MHRANTIRRVALTAIAATVLAAPGTSEADPGHRPRRVVYSVTRQLTGGDAPCDTTTPTRCVGTFQNLITYTGDMSGTSYASGSAALAPDGIYRATAIEQFSGSITGCGTGTLIIEQSGTLDPVTGADDGTWRIVPGTGTGDLANASGASARTRPGAPLRALIRCR